MVVKAGRRATAILFIVLMIACAPPARHDRMPTSSPTRRATATPTLSALNLYKTVPVRVVDRAWTVEALLARSELEASSVWANGEELTFFCQREAEAVHICCGIQLPMQRVENSDSWALTVHIDQLSQAVISYTFIPYQDARPLRSREAMAETQVWRGPESPPAPQRAESLQGQISSHVIDSTHLGEIRELTVYLPPGHSPTHQYPVVYAADGQAVDRFAAVLDPQVLKNSVPAVIVVGVHSAEGGGAAEAYDPDQDLRGQEYLLAENPGRFEAHERFFVDEVSDWAQRTLGASTIRQACAVFGFSNGGAFAVSMGIRHPDRYGTIIAFSLGEGQQGWGTPDWTTDAAPRHYLVAGTLEPFQGTTARWAATLARVGVEHVHRERVCGHDPVMWEEEFPRAVAWAFRDQ